jgi:hypothetical protein
MATSLRDIAVFMDPVDETIGLRHVAEHHRWTGQLGTVSLAQLGGRHTHPESVRLRFLWYNTYLMRVSLALAKGLADAATAREVMEALNVTPRQLLDEYDVCNLLPSGPGPVPGPREACELAGNAVNFVIDWLGGVDAAVNAVIDRLGAEKAIEIVLRIAGVPGVIELKAKPALKPRAREIGEVLRGDGYDVAALCETWNADLRTELLGAWQLPASGKHRAAGKKEGDAFLGDGLLFGSPPGRILEVVRHGYETRGISRPAGRVFDMIADDELWAEKGALLVRIDAGVGVVDLYLTHLYFGTGLAGSDVAQYFGHVAPPNNSERREVRAAQLEELSGFIEATHHPQNVALVCGDFNIDATGRDPDYGGLDALKAFIERHRLQDRWSRPHDDLPGSTGGSFGKICGIQHPADARFCLDSAVAEANHGYRIDLLLAEEPTSQHAFMLDVTRVRRRSFPRPQITEGQAHMSDHLGLDCTLLASPV